jgi:hypothetical protein
LLWFVFFNWFFFQFYHSTSSTFDCLLIKPCYLFWFVFYEIIVISWLESQVSQINHNGLRSFYCIFFFRLRFSQFHHSTIDLLRIEFYNLFNLFYLWLSWFYNLSQEFERLIQINLMLLSQHYFFKVLSWIFTSQTIFLSIIQIIFESFESIGSYRFNSHFFICIWNLNWIISS